MPDQKVQIPTQTEMYSVVLSMVKDGKEFRRKDISHQLYHNLGLEGTEIATTSSGVPVYTSRVNWAITHLHSAGLLTRKEKAVYCISKNGQNLLKEEQLSPQDFAAKMWAMEKSLEHAEDVPPQEDTEDISPEEQIDKALAAMNDQLAHDIMYAIMEKEGPEGNKFFEKVVTDLLVKMGYGEGTQTQFSHDGGIDGIIKTDPLGFDPILIQAKRYAPGNNVGEPTVNTFAGALKRVRRGVLITTSFFTQGAMQAAKEFPHADIALIDGQKLTQLMIKYNLGVLDEREIHIKKLDKAYFDEE